MIFTEEYFQGEERDGFYVRPMMKRAWAAQLEVLNEIDRICKKHDIKYFAYAGTLLGAVRHQGFIPWDDDMDLAMLRGNYERFRRYARKELPEGWYVSDTQPTIIRIVNSDRIRVDQEFLGKFHGCPYMVGVDIYCWDCVPQDKREEKAVVNLFWSIAYLSLYWDHFDEGGQQVWEEARAAGARNIENITGYHFNWNLPMKDQLTDLADHVAAMYWDEEFKEASRIFKMYDRPEYRIPRVCFDKIIEVPFEITTIPVLEQYDLMLRNDYGDNYMTPVKSFYHTYPFFEDQIDILKARFEKQGDAFPKHFDWEEK